MHVGNVVCMSTLQIRDVPDDVRRTLKERAARSGKSLSSYALEELARSARRPTIAELDERILTRGAAHPTTPAADLIRADRDERR